MKKTIVLAAALLIAAGASAQEKNFLDKPYIEVTGKADMEVTPDEIYVRIVINEKDNKGKVSVEQQEKEMFRRLKAAHIDIEKDLVVQDMSSDLQTYFLRKNAILSTKTYQLKVSSAAQLGQAFEALQAAGIADVNIERTDVSNMDELPASTRRCGQGGPQERRGAGRSRRPNGRSGRLYSGLRLQHAPLCERDADGQKRRRRRCGRHGGSDSESGIRKNQDRALGHGPLSAELSERT